MLGLVGAAAVLMSIALMARPRSTPPRSPSPEAALLAPAAPVPDRPGVPAPEWTPPAGMSDARLRALNTQVQVETSVLAALREQTDQTRRELVDLQDQQQAARAALADVQHRLEVVRGEIAGQQRQQQEESRALVVRPETARPAPSRPAASSSAEPAAAEAPRPVPPPSTAALSRVLNRLRQPPQPGAEEESAASAQRSPPPGFLGQLAVPAARPEPPQPAKPEPTPAPAAKPEPAPAPVAKPEPVPAPAAKPEPASTPAAKPETVAVATVRPKVIFYYRTGSPHGQENASDLARRLLFSDFAYAETRVASSGPIVAAIRFFHRADADAAQRLANLLRGAGTEFWVQDGTGMQSGAAPGTLEVWLPL
ncbi:SPOR domain-containing protein [Rhodovastum atsumiense]|nr:SPOR domain-containing protein [Rhodovastum atsumiense]